MAATSFKALLFLTAGCTAVAATAYVSDVFDRGLAHSLATHESVPGTDPKNARLSELGATVSGTAPMAPSASQSPSFDLVRVESDGSIVIAGKTRPYAKVEIEIGTRIVGSTVAAAGGDFAIVIDEPLKPGGYQIVLRSIGPDDVIATSPETAVVSIPESKGGQVLVLIQQPGEPSRMVTLPEMMSTGPAAASGQINAIGVPAPVELSPAVPTGVSRVAVEAVEIDGRAVFVAGMADAGRQVRVYIDDVLLGDTRISPDGRFLLEAERDLPVGNHILRVDALDLDGMVAARAAVPFEREPGETVAAVRPTGLAAVPKEPAAGVNAEAETATPKLQNVDSAVIIRRGDTLWRISRRVYGRGVRYSTIYLANQAQIRNPNRIWPGQVFTIPEMTPEGDPANMGAVDKQVATFKQ